MGRNIVICFDGTNSEYAAVNTNVVKLYALLDRSGVGQLAYYQPGIGTMDPPGFWGKRWGKIVKVIDSAIAWLLEEHVTSGYRFLMRYYEPGDRIFIFGFSRGAYSARVLAAMLNKMGLLTMGNEELIPFAWDLFKRTHNQDVSSGFEATFSRAVKIHFLGLWDTVRSVGWITNPIHFEYTMSNPIVEVVRHAVAIDERRAYFPQNLWTSNPPPAQDVLQLWFAGVHCDVGGGYREPEAGLSKIALQWMVAEAERQGLLTVQAAKDTIIPAGDTPAFAAPNPAAMQHESLKGLWWLLEWIPKRIQDPERGFETRWVVHCGRHRYIAPGAQFHPSVRERMQRVPAYRPPNVPPQ
jgi:uncharacterized protein (DUF2235 family)